MRSHHRATLWLQPHSGNVVYSHMDMQKLTLHHISVNAAVNSTTSAADSGARAAALTGRRVAPSTEPGRSLIAARDIACTVRRKLLVTGFSRTIRRVFAMLRSSCGIMLAASTR